MTASLAQITNLWKEFKEVPVLSLYLPVGKGGTLERGSWRLRADALLDESRARIAAAEDDQQDAFDEARAHLARLLDDEKGLPPRGTWVLFSTPERLIFSQFIEVALPPLAAFGAGPRIAPMVGLAELSLRGVVALVDAERARLFSVVGPDLTEIIALIADRRLEELSDVGVAKRAGTTTGVRGQAGKDRAEKAWAAELVRFARQVKEAAMDLEGTDGFLVVGGALRMEKALVAQMESTVPMLEVPGLTVEMTESDLWRAIRKPLAAFHDGRAALELDHIQNSVGRKGRGCLGWNDTMRALAAASVQTLVVSDQLVREHVDRAESLVRSALDQGASVEVVTGEPGAALLEEQEGVAALLRFPVAAVVESRVS